MIPGRKQPTYWIRSSFGVVCICKVAKTVATRSRPKTDHADRKRMANKKRNGRTAYMSTSYGRLQSGKMAILLSVKFMNRPRLEMRSRVLNELNLMTTVNSTVAMARG